VRCRSWIAVGLSVAVLSVGGCTFGDRDPFGDLFVGRSGPAHEPARGELLPRGRLAVTLWGSGSCPTLARRVLVQHSDAVVVIANADYRAAAQLNHGDVICSADSSPTRSVIALPLDRLQLDHGLRVTIRADAHTYRPFVVR
jgi:hypothetical protein